MKDVIWDSLVDRPMTGLTGDTLVKSIEHSRLLGIPYDCGVVFTGNRGQPIENQQNRKELTEFVGGWDIQSLEQFVESGEKVCARLLKYQHNMRQTILVQSEVYLRALADLTPYMYAIFSMEQVLEERLKSMLPASLSVGEVLNNPKLASDNALFDQAILRLAVAGCPPNRANVIIKKYGYLQLTNHLATMPFQYEEIVNLCAGCVDPQAELEKIQQKEAELYQCYQQKIAKLNGSTKQYLKLMHRYQEFRNERIKTFKLLQFRLLKPIAESVVTKNISFDDAIWYTLDELTAFAKTQIPVDVKARKKNYCIVKVADKITYTFQSPLTAKTAGSTVLIGRCAQPGQATGKVRILLESKDVETLRPGEVLVTTMTTPDLVPAMRRSAAIVTDEGGILCHAAIVSRELGIPCVIGTHEATKVLKNGQSVFVDATKGIVKPLSL